MKTTLTSIAFCAAAVLISSNALAQTQSANSDTNTPPSTNAPSATTAQRPSPGQQNSSLQQASAEEFFRASDLVGKNTQDSKGTKVGEIKEIAFNQQGEIFAFIDAGAGKWAAVPWQVINAASAKGKGNVTLNATQQQLKAGPAVTKDQWGSLNNPKFVQGCYAYYNVQSPTATGGASSPGGSSESQGQKSTTEPQQ